MRRHTLDEIRACKKGTKFTNPISQTMHDFVYSMIRLRRRRMYRLRDAQEVEDWFPAKLQRMFNENMIVPDGKGGYYFRPGGDKNELKKLGKALLIFFLVRSCLMDIDPTKNNNKALKATVDNLILYYGEFASHLIEAWKVVLNKPLALFKDYPEGLEPEEGTHEFPMQKFRLLKDDLEKRGLLPLPEPQEEWADEESDESHESDEEGEGLEEEQAVVGEGIAHMLMDHNGIISEGHMDTDTLSLAMGVDLEGVTHTHTDNDDSITNGYTDVDTLSVATVSPGGSCMSTEDTLTDADMCVESMKDLDAWLDMYLPVEGGLKREREHGDGFEGDRCDNKRIKPCVDASDVDIIKLEPPLSILPPPFDIKFKLEEPLRLTSAPPTIAPTATYTPFMPKHNYTFAGFSTTACIDTALHTHTAAAINPLLIKKEEGLTMGFKQEEYDVKGCMGGFCMEAPDDKECADELRCNEKLGDEEQEEFHPLAVEALAIMFPELIGKGAWFEPYASFDCSSQ